MLGFLRAGRAGVPRLGRVLGRRECKRAAARAAHGGSVGHCSTAMNTATGRSEMTSCPPSPTAPPSPVALVQLHLGLRLHAGAHPVQWQRRQRAGLARRQMIRATACACNLCRRPAPSGKHRRCKHACATPHNQPPHSHPQTHEHHRMSAIMSVSCARSCSTSLPLMQAASCGEEGSAGQGGAMGP